MLYCKCVHLFAQLLTFSLYVDHVKCIFKNNCKAISFTVITVLPVHECKILMYRNCKIVLKCTLFMRHARIGTHVSRISSKGSSISFIRHCRHTHDVN